MTDIVKRLRESPLGTESDDIDIVDRLDGEHDEDALRALIVEMNEQLAWAERVLAAKETTLVHLLARALADTTRRLLSFLS